MITAEEKGLASSSKLISWQGCRLIRIVVSVGIVIWILSKIDCSAAFEAVRSTRSSTLIAAIGLVLLAHVISAIRLYLLLGWQRADISFGKTLEMTFAGLLAGNFLPSTIGGDAVKILGLIKTGMSNELVTATVVLDRMISLVAMLFLLPTAIMVPRLLSHREMIFVGVLVLAGFFLVILFFSAVYFLGASQIRNGTQKNQIPGLLSWLRTAAYRFHLHLLFFKENPLAWITAVLLSWAFFMSAILAMWALAFDLGIGVGYLEMVGTLAIVYFVSLLPVSLNGLGIQEGTLILLLAHFGATSPQSLALAGIARLIQITLSLLGIKGFIGLGNKRSN